MAENNIDNLFRNKFENLKVSPPEDTWENISRNLPEKKKRRVVALWWSAAAVFLALISSGTAYYWLQQNQKQIHSITLEESKESTPAIQEPFINHSLTETQKKQSVNEQSIKIQEETIRKTEEESRVAYNEAEKESKSEFASNKMEEKPSELNSKYAMEVKEKTKISIIDEEEIVKEDRSNYFEKQDIKPAPEQVALTETLEKEEPVLEITSLLEETKLFAEEEVIDKDTKHQGRWSVGAQVAPVYYNSMSGGSSLDEQFSDSPKSGELNMSLGLQVAYRINDNWQLRTGINKVDVGYATDNVQVGYSDPYLAIENVKYHNVASGTPVVTAFSNNKLSEIRSSSEHVNRIEVLNLSGNTQLKQSISYLEIPLEIERKIIRSDFEWSIIGGMSSLFLIDNNVYVHNKEYSYDMGKASNLQTTSFSANIGMGFGYKLSEHLHLQLEPKFKYQLNAYRNSVDFKPYIFGVYTGVSWRLD